MVGFFRFFLLLFLSASLFSCKKESDNIVFESDRLVVKQLSDKAFVHTSFLHTRVFGKVKCNGAIFINKKEAIILDTPTNNDASNELIDWIESDLNAKIVALIPTHFHEDCVGGIAAFEKKKIPSFATTKTIELAKAADIYISSEAFDSQLEVAIGGDVIYNTHFGAGHTFDNIVSYYPSEKVLFGGCLLKSIGANKGYLGDADTTEWTNTIKKIQSTYSDVNIVIPGHGMAGDSELLDYTATLFEGGSN